MPAFRASGSRGMFEELISPGDVLILGESSVAGANTTNGASVLTAAQITSGVIFRSGSGAGYTDTFDTSTNILAALSAGNPGPAIIPGSCFKLRIVNTVAFLETLTLGAGMVAGSGSIASVAASTWRDFLFTFTNVQPPTTVVANITNGSPTATLVLPPGAVAIPIGVSPFAVNVLPGAVVSSASGITAGTTVLGVTQGQGGITAITLSANATATVNGASLTFSPAIRVDSLGSGTL